LARKGGGVVGLLHVRSYQREEAITLKTTRKRRDTGQHMFSRQKKGKINTWCAPERTSPSWFGKKKKSLFLVWGRKREESLLPPTEREEGASESFPDPPRKKGRKKKSRAKTRSKERSETNEGRRSTDVLEGIASALGGKVGCVKRAGARHYSKNQRGIDRCRRRGEKAYSRLPGKTRRLLTRKREGGRSVRRPEKKGVVVKAKKGGEGREYPPLGSKEKKGKNQWKEGEGGHTLPTRKKEIRSPKEERDIGT